MNDKIPLEELLEAERAQEDPMFETRGIAKGVLFGLLIWIGIALAIIALR